MKKTENYTQKRFRLVLFTLLVISFICGFSIEVYAEDEMEQDNAVISDSSVSFDNVDKENPDDPLGQHTAPKEDPVKNGVILEENHYYYYVDGTLQTTEGIIVWNNNSYYVTSTGELAVNQMVCINGRYYYVGKDAITKKSSGWVSVAGEQYLLKSDGHATVSEWIKDNNGWRWFDETGKLVKNKRITYKGQYYFLKSNSYMASNGWVKDGNKWSFAESNGSLIRNRWIKSKSEWYYLKSDAYMAANDWVKYGRYWYWMNGSGRITRSGWVYTGGKWYYLKSNGYMAASEWLLYKSSWYYLNGSGAMAASQWVKRGGKWYYLKSDGRMAKNEWIKDNGYWYYLKSDGRMAANEWVQSYWVNSSGAWIPPSSAPASVQSYSSKTSYLIIVSRSAHYVTIYQGSKGHWVKLTGFSCGDGKPSTPTITGEYSIPNKYPKNRPYFDSEGARCWYPTRINGAYLFHSVLYYPDSSPSRVLDGTVGRGVSHGCVRLALNNAKWIYDNIPIGTKVVIF